MTIRIGSKTLIAIADILGQGLTTFQLYVKKYEKVEISCALFSNKFFGIISALLALSTVQLSSPLLQLVKSPVTIAHRGPSCPAIET